MDLYAYGKIESLGELAKANGIEVPRLRGYRLMSEEEPYTEEEIEKAARETYKETFNLYKPQKGFHMLRPDFGLYNRREAKGVARRYAKYVRKQLRTFNKYAGKEGVLMVHARIGGPNWTYYGGHLLKFKPWFIEAVTDGGDETYCDIYVRVKKEE